MNISTGNKRRE